MKKPSVAEHYFDMLTLNRIDRAGRRARLVIAIACGALLLAVLLLFLSFQMRDLRAVSVVELCPAETATGGPLSESTIGLFARYFASLYSEQSPDIAEKLATAYNLMTPRYQQILLAKRVDAGRAEKWFDKNIKSDLVIERLRIAPGTKVTGTPVALRGIGSMHFRPMVGWTGDRDPYRSSSVRAFFQMSVMVVPVTEKTPWGLLVDDYAIDYFSDDELLRAFLLERKISME